MVADMMANMVTDMVDDKVGEKKIALKKKEFLLRAGGRTGSLPSYGSNKLVAASRTLSWRRQHSA